ncbi:MAG: S8 family serine peptidase [Desulfobacterales bacterium]|nr:S8 family serine peptidase [Desulfobacterales bacterium]
MAPMPYPKTHKMDIEGQKPIEMVFMIAPVSGNYSIKIKSTVLPEIISHFSCLPLENLSKYNIENSSLGALASCPEVITVGAVDASNLQLENYSSMGPAIDGRLKPDIVAPDNVNHCIVPARKVQRKFCIGALCSRNLCPGIGERPKARSAGCRE